MKKLALGALFVGLLAACGGGGNNSKTMIVVTDGSGSDGGSGTTCNPLTQAGCAAGEKCTWFIDQATPTYVGHIGCAPDGTAAIGAACYYGTTSGSDSAPGPDNCKKGSVCSSYRDLGAAGGVCKQICDNTGGAPMCDSTHVCVTYADIWSTGASSPAAAGVCDLQCDPLTDNDFDGSGSASHKTTMTCGTSAREGCYGAPSQGTPPATGWSCTGDINTGSDGTDKGLRHRTECTTATGCATASGTIYLNSCNQGYEPLFIEATGNSTAVCIAICKPLDCYAGNCGTNDNNRLGAVGNRCSPPDRVGSFDVTKGGEECEYLWAEELDGSGNWLPSSTSNSVGVCFDHRLYKYDPTGGNNPTIQFPGCEALQLMGSGSDKTMPTTYFGAVDFGCVNTTLAGFGSGSARGKVSNRFDGVTVDRPRFLYHRVMGAN